MTTVGLIRHGITEWNTLGRAQGISDIPLNDLGIIQAKAIGNRLLQEEKWDILITSDLSRAMVTGEIIGEKINLPISHIEKRVREIDCGKMEGTTLEERISKWGNSWREQDLEMEKFEDVGKRGEQFLEEIILRYPGKRILIVSHGAFIGLTLKQILPAVFQDTYIDNTSLTILNHSDGNWECTLYNCTKHII